MIKDDKKQYTQQWSEYNQAQTREKALFMKLLYDLCQNIKDPEYDFGRPKLPLSDIIFCSVFKVYSLYSGRRFTTDMKLAEELGLIEKTPHFNSIFNYLRKSEITRVLLKLIELSSLPLKAIEKDFAVDSSGFSTAMFGRWLDYKHRKVTTYRSWIKAHIMIGVKTKIVTGVVITEGNAADITQFSELTAQTSRNFNMREISGDKAYLSRDNLELVNEYGAIPFIPFKKSTRPAKKGSSMWRDMWHFFNLNRDLFDQHYHKRSNVETAFQMIKSKFGNYVRSKNHISQMNEVLCKILCHNISVVIHAIYELKINPNFD